MTRMADDGGGKRLEMPGVCDVESLQQRRIAELESEIEQLRLENAQLSGRGNHEVLPVDFEVVVTSRVDLSRIDTSIFTQITSYVGTSRELLGLALTCKSFGWRQTTSTLNWSLAEEVARQEVCSKATDVEMSSLPQYARGTTTWLSILHRFQHLLLFDVLLGNNIEYQNGDKSTVQTTAAIKSTVQGTATIYNAALSSGYVMSSGSHYAEFQIGETPFIGVVRPMPGLDAGAYQEEFYFVGESGLLPDFLAQRSDDWGDGDVHACEYFSFNGRMSWTDWEDAGHMGLQWEGKEWKIATMVIRLGCC
ncbi:hypothetical protein THAOC_33185 [Thalassiosira oceanica]|uniref:F-box domain-containing protein n=1 Tax=Thalassiosira oceanica TaxID=159749 RepID=K0RMT4_THAOC|nr:hypothetical protein THAOC_33185 [Thalassiosira oceanica]|eukprot:EJK48052.1 hypothetical protein THAOC_33185 [Thalassiosira oceanica]